jgi:hypothetical protein
VNESAPKCRLHVPFYRLVSPGNTLSGFSRAGRRANGPPGPGMPGLSELNSNEHATTLGPSFRIRHERRDRLEIARSPDRGPGENEDLKSACHSVYMLCRGDGGLQPA